MKFEHALASLVVLWLICWGVQYKTVDDIAALCEANGRFVDNDGSIWECRGVGGYVDERRPSVIINPARLGPIGE